MEACYEYLGCDKQECPAYVKKENMRCWEVAGTLCNHPGIELVRKRSSNGNKEDSCIRSGCIYYTAVKKFSKQTTA
jgi:hypothetical protein